MFGSGSVKHNLGPNAELGGEDTVLGVDDKLMFILIKGFVLLALYRLYKRFDDDDQNRNYSGVFWAIKHPK